MIYLIIFIFLICVRFALNDEALLRRQLFPGFIFSIFIFSAFRFQVGCDWHNYNEQYLGYNQDILNSFSFTGEPFYAALIQALQFFDLSYPWLNVATSFIFFFGVYKLAIRQPDPLATLIFMFPILILNMPMSGIRQGAAIGMMCFAYLAFIDKKIFKYLIFTILASGFHTSALIFLFFIPFLGGNFSYGRIFLAILLGVPGLLLLVSSSFAQIAIERYITNSYEAYGAIYRIFTLVISAIMFLIFFRTQWKEKYEDEYILMMLASLMMLFCMLMVFVSSTIADRIGYFIIPLQAVLFARIPFFKVSWKIFWVAFPYVIISIIFIAWMAWSSLFQACYLPYNNFLLGVPYNEITLFK